MLAEARLATGLYDFGDDSFRQALDVLLGSCSDETRLNPSGLRALRRHCIDSLITRLRVQDYWNRHPEIAEVPVVRPLFVLGLPCSGTDLAVRLLSQDPESRWFRFWELLCPSPSPLADDRNDSRIRVARQWIDDYGASVPAGDALDAEGPDECSRLFQHNFTSLSFTTRYCLTEYAEWLSRADMRPAYGYYKKLLQVLVWKRGGCPIVLHDPFHLWHLGPLLEIFPDACIVQLHRDPAEVAPAWSRMCARAERVSSDHVDPRRTAAQWIERLADGLGRMMTVREAANPASFLDISSSRLARDPIGSVRQIYAHFGLPLRETSAGRMHTWLAAHPPQAPSTRRDASEASRLNSASQEPRFAGYRDRYRAVLES
jgi:hypothetical protein